MLGLAILLWGTAFRAHAVGTGYAPPLVFASLRVIPAAVLLTTLAIASGWRLSRREGAWAALTGLLMVAGTLGGLSAAVPLVGAAHTAVIFNSYTFFIVVAGVWVLREPLSVLGIVGISIGFAGLVILMSSEMRASIQPQNLLLGTAIASAAALAWGGGTVIVIRLLRSTGGVHLLSFTAVQYLAGGVALAVLGMPAAGQVEWGASDLWLAVAWVSLGSSAIATVAFFKALRCMSAAEASSWQFLVPTIAVLVDATVGSTPSQLGVTGMAVSIAGLCIVSLTARMPAGH